ncbi:MAG: type IV pilus assembly protein PilM [Phycisphaerae bacterium]|nr:type IV pilus assembly protein PilM [Phycisphaerae bacterium]
MASKTSCVWAIDIGNNSLKALRLTDINGAVEVLGFENIAHGKILSGKGVTDQERRELIAISLHECLEKNNVRSDKVIISVPSQNSFARFVNLPPVDKNRIPEIVKFEAAQQIPFDINEVQWDWQLMSGEGSAEKRVGLFAIKNEVVSSELAHFAGENIAVSCVQMAPMALYNFILYDRPELFKSEREAIAVLNMGAEATDLIVCTANSVWQRCIPMGGNSFTRAISEAFKLNFQKAEKLKRTAPMSKYARQILQAMKPVFSDLSSEIQRSLGFYTSSNPNVKIVKMIALGGGTKMRGLVKYLQQSLQIQIERPDTFNRLAVNTDAAKFHENVGDFGVVYGLALQGLGYGKIESNLIPKSAARASVWRQKAKYFTAAAVMLLAVSLLSFGRTFMDMTAYNSSENQKLRRDAKDIIRQVDDADRKLSQEENKGPQFDAKIDSQFELFQYREIIPQLYETLLSVLPNEKNTPDQKELYEAFAAGNVDGVLQMPRKQRKQIFVTSVSIQFSKDIETAALGRSSFSQSRPQRGSETEMDDSDMVMPGMGGPGGFYPPPSRGGRGVSRERGRSSESTETGQAGFVVTVAGYSPYENILELMDPIGTKDDQLRWGVVTRLLNLKKIVDGNSPFELYKKLETAHFELKVEPVQIGGSIPTGVGLMKNVESDTKTGQKETILVDPMTDEVISQVARKTADGRVQMDRQGKPVYETNDYWFELKAKFAWKNAPKFEAEDTGGRRRR